MQALYENMLVELPFASFFLSKLLGTSADVDIHHLASLDPEMYRNLLFLKSYEGDVEELGLNFTVVNNDLGEAQVTGVGDTLRCSLDKWFTCPFFLCLFSFLSWSVPLIQLSFLPPVWLLFVALIIHFPHDVPLFSPERDKARRHCRPKLCCSAANTAALLTVPPAFPPGIISEHAWQKQLAALKHVPSKAQGCRDELPPPLWVTWAQTCTLPGAPVCSGP